MKILSILGLAVVVSLGVGCASLKERIKPGHAVPADPREIPVRTVKPIQETWVKCDMFIRSPSRRVYTEDAHLKYSSGAVPIYVPAGKEMSQRYTVVVKIPQPNVRDFVLQMRNYGRGDCKRMD